MNPTDHIQVVTFQLAGLEPDAYRAHCEAAAPAFTPVSVRNFSPPMSAASWRGMARAQRPDGRTRRRWHLADTIKPALALARAAERVAGRDPGSRRWGTMK